jgi:uncharacterized protein CbrC (UPF0167 family)
VQLPHFRYHPDPVATGSAVASSDDCEVCGEPAEYRYEGSVYGEDAEVICLSCIASGRASQALGQGGEAATFTDLDDSDEWDEVDDAVVDEVLHRTPGFAGWQQETWLAHCADAAAFNGPAGAVELARDPGAGDAVRTYLESEGYGEDELEEALQGMSRDGAPTAYLFTCLHCGERLAYVDFP